MAIHTIMTKPGYVFRKFAAEYQELHPLVPLTSTGAQVQAELIANIADGLCLEHQAQNRARYKEEWKKQPDFPSRILFGPPAAVPEPVFV